MTVLLIPIQLVVEGYSWQMVPAYALAGLLFVFTTLQLSRRNNAPTRWGRKVIHGIGLSLGLVLFTIAAALPALFPVFQLPEPTGPYAVGTTSFAFTDDSRQEIFTDIRRCFLADQVWI